MTTSFDITKNNWILEHRAGNHNTSARSKQSVLVVVQNVVAL